MGEGGNFEKSFRGIMELDFVKLCQIKSEWKNITLKDVPGIRDYSIEMNGRNTINLRELFLESLYELGILKADIIEQLDYWTTNNPESLVKQEWKDELIQVEKMIVAIENFFEILNWKHLLKDIKKMVSEKVNLKKSNYDEWFDLVYSRRYSNEELNQNYISRENKKE